MAQNLTDDKSTLVQVMAWQQSITWTSVDQDLQCHMVLLGPNELNRYNSGPMKTNLVYVMHILS